MARGPENTFIASVHRHLPHNLYRMKNHNQYNGGIADCWYSGPQGDLWIEYKFIELPKRADTLIDLCNGADPPLSSLQQEWLRARHGEGRKVAVVVGSKNGGIWFDSDSWSQPLTASAFTARMQTRQGLADRIARITGAGP